MFKNYFILLFLINFYFIKILANSSNFNPNICPDEGLKLLKHPHLCHLYLECYNGKYTIKNCDEKIFKNHQIIGCGKKVECKTELNQCLTHQHGLIIPSILSCEM